jgi:hypothetical protein
MSDLLPSPPQEWSGVDLHLQGLLLAAEVWKPNPLISGGYEGGRVVTYDEEGMLVARFSRAKGKLEMHVFRLFYTDIDPQATSPGSLLGRYKLARDICAALGERRTKHWDNWDRKLLGHAAYMVNPRST